MSSELMNTLILVAFIAVIGAIGYVVTGKQQPAELERLHAEEEVFRQRQSDNAQLMLARASSSEEAERLFRQWNTRYKVLPDQLSSPDVVRYLNQLSSAGFRAFDIALAGATRSGSFSKLTYDVNGTAFYESLYGFIWNIENSRGLFHVRNLRVEGTTVSEPNPTTGVNRSYQVVNFSMSLDAFFGGTEDMAASDSIMVVPDHVFAARRSSHNPFFPAILSDIPPNSEDLIDIESDSLVSVIGNTAIFLRRDEPRTIREGDRVYLGRVTRIDANRARVTAELNKGGISERIELSLQTGDRFRQAFGNYLLTPYNEPTAPSFVPPAPGTPEARRREGAPNETDARRRGDSAYESWRR